MACNSRPVKSRIIAEFILVSPWSSGPRWSAGETGDGWGRRRLDIWDAETDKEISEKIEAHKARLKWRDLRAKIDAVKEPTMALCEAIEAALLPPSDQNTPDNRIPRKP